MMAKLLLILTRRAFLLVQCHSPAPLTTDDIAAAIAIAIAATIAIDVAIDVALTLAFTLDDVSIAVARMRMRIQ
jgi:hypothetical protein